MVAISSLVPNHNLAIFMTSHITSKLFHKDYITLGGICKLQIATSMMPVFAHHSLRR